MKILINILFIVLVVCIPFTQAEGQFYSPTFSLVDDIETIFDKYEVSIAYAPFCKHLFSDNPNYNERDNHIFMFQVNQIFFITFRNSYYDRTWGFGYTFRTEKWEPFNNDFFVRGNLPIGIIYGYENRNIHIGKFSPGAIPALEFGYGKNFSINTTVYPVATILFTYTF